MNLKDKFDLACVMIQSMFMGKNQRLRLKFLDDSSLTKYYDLLLMRIDDPNQYKRAMNELYNAATKEYSRCYMSCGICRLIECKRIRDSLCSEGIMSMYRFWNKKTCDHLFVIDVDDSRDPRTQYANERYFQIDDNYYNARVELARHWLDVMTFVDNHF